MMQQIQQITLQKQKIESLKAAQEDYEKLVQKLVGDLKTEIRSGITAGIFADPIEGDLDLPLRPSAPCGTVPVLDEPSPYFSYDTSGRTNLFCWSPVCRGIYDGKRMASKNVCIELTDAGKKLLSDLTAAAREEGILLSYQPALVTRSGKVILPRFGQYEKVDHPQHGKKGVLENYFVNIHYVIE